jgi:anaerobic carbon-monoxide dehydrogenase iron sulfur subunit
MAKVIMIHPDRCTGCRSCELACSFFHEEEFRPRASRVHVYSWERESISVPMMCQHCESAACVNVCPTGAMHHAATGSLVEWDATRCIRCRMCTMACPFGCAVYDAKNSSILKCDMCDGSPECVTYCPNNALEYEDDTLATRTRKKAYASKFKDAFTEVH